MSMASAAPGTHTGHDTTLSQHAAAGRFTQVRDATTRLAAPLSAEDCALQSMPDASPVKWHLAHTTWFFETFVLERFEPRFAPFAPAFRMLFNSYYNAVGPKHPRPERGLLSRPSLDEVRAYRTNVDERVQQLLSRAPAATELVALVELGVQHEQQHQELILTDVKHLLGSQPLQPAYSPSWPLANVAARARGWVDFPEGLREIGHPGEGFHFDNEAPRHRVWLDAFSMATSLVTHGEVLAFVEDGGYRRPELWLAAGWDAVRSQGWEAPLYWRRHEGAWQTFTLHGPAPLDPHTPACHLSFYEAEAFARWAGARLPTEAEWEVASGRAAGKGNFVESGMLHPVASSEALPAGSLAQMFGDAWEWTRSDYAPYPGFRPAAGAVGEYNGKFMCNQYVLRGGSCVTPRGHVRPTYRNFFPAHARWQFSGLRLARDA
jgi:ergothioneine biosynthesis protein EgtB